MSSRGEKAIQDDGKPRLEATTLWDYPRQSYGKVQKGDNRFQGVTPAFIIYNMLMRYTAPDDTVLDPMCGSGTTIDVCREEGRNAIGLDIAPRRKDIMLGDARHLPLSDSSVDMVFVDSPYGDNVPYSDNPNDLGKLSAEDEALYREFGKVAAELYRVLKDGKVLGWLIGDQWVRKRFTPVGFRVYDLLVNGAGFIPVDIICVVRRNQSSNTALWNYRARKWNFYLRGHKYLILVRKPDGTESAGKAGRVQWKKYK